MVFGFILIPLAVCGVLAFVLRFYKLDEEYPEIRRELDRRYAGGGKSHRIWNKDNMIFVLHSVRSVCSEQMEH